MNPAQSRASSCSVGFNSLHIFNTSHPISLLSGRQRPVRNGNEPHSFCIPEDLKSYPPAHITGPDNANPKRRTLVFQFVKRCIDNYHFIICPLPVSWRSEKSGQFLSLSEIVIGEVMGHWIANSGSSQRSPPSEPGT